MKLQYAFLYSLFISVVIAQHKNDILRRITRFNPARIEAKPGDTVKLGWQYNLDAKIRSERLGIFFCGYRGKSLKSALGEQVSQIIPLAYDYVGDTFHTVSSQVPPVRFKLPRDNLELNKKVTAYKDRVANVHYIEINKIDEKFDSLNIICELRYKTQYAADVSIGGDVRIKILKLQETIATKSSKNGVQHGKIFLGAILFDALLISIVLSANVLLKRRKKGYSSVPTEDLSDKQKQDIENSVSTGHVGTRNKTIKLTRPLTPTPKLTSNRSETEPSSSSQNVPPIRREPGTRRKQQLVKPPSPRNIIANRSKSPLRPPPPNKANAQGVSSSNKGDTRQRKSPPMRPPSPRQFKSTSATRSTQENQQRRKQRPKSSTGNSPNQSQQKPKKMVTSGGFGTPENPRNLSDEFY